MIISMPSRKQLVWLVVILDIFVVAGLAFLLIRNRQKTAAPNTSSLTTNEPTPVILPTRSPEETKIISKKESKSVEIKNNAFSPPHVTAKVHDQIQWTNQDSVTHQVQGEDWGSPIPLKTGQSFTQSFDKVGVYPYFCKLHPEMKGSITIK